MKKRRRNLKGILKRKDRKKKKYSNKAVSLSTRLKDVRFDKSKLDYIRQDISNESSFLENYLRRVSSRKFVNNEIRTFCGSIINVCHSLPEMIVRKTEITSRVVRCLKICQDPETLMVVCRSIVIMTKELRNEIYTIYRDEIFDQLVERINHFTLSSDIDRISNLFESLYFSMKFLLNYMSNETVVWFDKFQKSLLCHKRVYIRKFSAQVFSVVIKSLEKRILENFLKKEFISKIYEFDVQCSQQPQRLRVFYDGLSWLLLEIVESTLGQFHSCTKIVFLHLLRFLEFEESSTKMMTTTNTTTNFLKRIFVMIEVTISRIVKYAKSRDSLSPLWKILGDEIKRVFEMMLMKINNNDDFTSRRRTLHHLSYLYGVLLVMTTNGRKKMKNDVYENCTKFLCENIKKIEELFNQEQQKQQRHENVAMKDEEEEEKTVIEKSHSTHFQVFLDAIVDAYGSHRIEFCKIIHPMILRLDFSASSPNNTQTLRFLMEVVKTILSRRHFESERESSLKPIIETLVSKNLQISGEESIYITKEEEEEEKANLNTSLAILLYIFEVGPSTLKPQFNQKFPNFVPNLIKKGMSPQDSPSVLTVLTMRLLRAFPMGGSEAWSKDLEENVLRIFEAVMIQMNEVSSEMKDEDEPTTEENINKKLLSETIFWFSEHFFKKDEVSASVVLLKKSFRELVKYSGSLRILESLCFFLDQQLSHTHGNQEIFFSVSDALRSPRILENLRSKRTLLRKNTLILLLLLHRLHGGDGTSEDRKMKDDEGEIVISEIQDTDLMMKAILMSLIECESLGLAFDVFSRKVFLIRRVVDILRFGKTIILKDLEKEEGGKSSLILKILINYLLGGLHTRFQDFYPAMKNLGWAVQDLWDGQAEGRTSTFEALWKDLYPELLRAMRDIYDKIREEQMKGGRKGLGGTVFRPKRREEEEYGLIKNVDAIFDSRFKPLSSFELEVTNSVLSQKREEDEYLVTPKKVYMDNLWDILFFQKSINTQPKKFEIIIEDVISMLAVMKSQFGIFKNLIKQGDRELERIESLMHLVNVYVKASPNGTDRIQSFESQIKPILIQFLQVKKTKVQLICLNLLKYMSDGKWITKYFKIIKNVMSAIGTFSITKISLFSGVESKTKIKMMKDEDDDEAESDQRQSEERKKYIELVVHFLLPHFQKRHKKEKQKVWEIRVFNLLSFFWNNLGESQEEIFFLLSKLLPEFSSIDEKLLESIEVYKTNFYISLISEIFKLPSDLLLRHYEVVERLQNVLFSFVLYDRYFLRTYLSSEGSSVKKKKKKKKMKDEDEDDEEEETEGETDNEDEPNLKKKKNKYEKQIKRAIGLIIEFSKKFQEFEYSESYLRKCVESFNDYLSHFKNHFEYFNVTSTASKMKREGKSSGIQFPTFFDVIFQWMSEPHLISMFCHPNVKKVLRDVIELCVFLGEKNISLKKMKYKQKEMEDCINLISTIFSLLERLSYLKDVDLKLDAVRRIIFGSNGNGYGQQFENQKISFIISEFVNPIIIHIHQLKVTSSKIFFHPSLLGKKKSRRSRKRGKMKRGRGASSSLSSTTPTKVSIDSSTELSKQCFRIIDLFYPLFRADSPCDLILSFYGSSFSLKSSQNLRETRAERVIQAFQRYIPLASIPIQMKYISNLSYMFVYQKDMNFRRRLCEIFKALGREDEDEDQDVSMEETKMMRRRRSSRSFKRNKNRKICFREVSKILVGMNTRKKETLSRMDYSELLENLQFLSNKPTLQNRFFNHEPQQVDSNTSNNNNLTTFLIDDYAILPILGNLFFYQRKKEVDIQSLSTQSIMVIIELMSLHSSNFTISTKFVLDNLFNTLKSKEILYECRSCETFAYILENRLFFKLTWQYSGFIQFFKTISKRGTGNKISSLKSLQNVVVSIKKRISGETKEEEEEQVELSALDLDKILMQLFLPMTLAFFRVPIHEDISVETILCILKNLTWNNFKKSFIQFLNPLKTSKHFSSIVCGRNVRIVNGMIDHFISQDDGKEFKKNNLVFGFFIHQVLHTLVTSPQLPNLLQMKEVGISKLLKFVPNVSKLRSHVSSLVKVLCQQMMKGKESSTLAKKVLMDLMMEIGILHLNYVLKILKDLMRQGRHVVTRNYVIHSILKKYSMEVRKLDQSETTTTTTKQKHKMKDEEEEDEDEEETELSKRKKGFNSCIPMLLDLIFKQISIENNDNLRRDKRNFEVLKNTFKHIGICMDMGRNNKILISILDTFQKWMEEHHKKEDFLEYVQQCLTSYGHGIVLNPSITDISDKHESQLLQVSSFFRVLERQFRKYRIFKKQFKQFFFDSDAGGDNVRGKEKKDPFLIQNDPKDEDFEETFLESSNPTNRILVSFIITTLSLYFSNLKKETIDSQQLQLSKDFLGSLMRFSDNPSQQSTLAFESVHLLTLLLNRSHPYFMEDVKNVERLLQNVFVLVELCGVETSSSHYKHLFSAFLSVIQHSSMTLSQPQWDGIITLVEQDILGSTSGDFGGSSSKVLNLPSFLILKELVCKRRHQHSKIYRMMYTVRELLLTIVQNQAVVEICRTILLDFLHYYRMSENILNDHLEFLIKQLMNPSLSSENRVYLLEAFEAIFSKFPYAFVTQKLDIFFIPLTLQFVRSEAPSSMMIDDVEGNKTMKKYSDLIVKIMKTLRSKEFYDIIFKKYIQVWLNDRTGKCQIVGIMILPLFFQAKPEDAKRIISIHKSSIWKILVSFLFSSQKKKKKKRKSISNNNNEDEEYDVQLLHYFKLWNLLVRLGVWNWKFILKESNGWSFEKCVEYLTTHRWNPIRIQILHFFDLLLNPTSEEEEGNSPIIMPEFLKLFKFEKEEPQPQQQQQQQQKRMKYHFRNYMNRIFQFMIDDLMGLLEDVGELKVHIDLISRNVFHLLRCYLFCIEKKEMKKFQKDVVHHLSEIQEKSLLLLTNNNNKNNSQLELLDLKINSVLKVYIKIANCPLLDHENLKMYVPHIIPLLFTILETKLPSAQKKLSFIEHTKEVVEFIRNVLGNEVFSNLYNEERKRRESERLLQESKIAELAISDPQKFARIKLNEDENMMKDEEEEEEEDIDKSIILRNMKRKREVFEDDEGEKKGNIIFEKDDEADDDQIVLPEKKKRKIMEEDEEEGEEE